MMVLLILLCHFLAGQLSATRCLCSLYECKLPDQAQCIIYSQHQVQLLRCKGDRRQEGEVLEAISQLYLSLGTKRCVHVEYDIHVLPLFLLQ